MLHRPSQLLEATGADLYRALYQLKARGVTRKIGISVYSPAELENILPKFDFDVVQIPFNLFDRRLVSSGWLRKLKDKGIEVHTRSTFLQGLLLMSSEDRPPQFGVWSDLWSKWDDWVADSGLSPMQICLAYSLGISEIDKIVIGADNALQLMEIIESAVSQDGIDIPDFACLDERLINPSNWGAL
jgi:aryl-alcohol dehydrogenase-like predicted oxidoreductase